MHRQKVAEVEKLTQTVRELEEAVLAGGAAANAVRDYQRKFQEMNVSKYILYDDQNKKNRIFYLTDEGIFLALLSRKNEKLLTGNLRVQRLQQTGLRRWLQMNGKMVMTK